MRCFCFRGFFGRSILPLTLVVPSLFGATPLQVKVAGISNTQAILSYVSPVSQPCTVEVSESNTFRPLVHDVDPALFEGGSDARSPSLNRGTQRVFVAGQRKAQKAADGHWYSRALQANQDHYYRVRCNGLSATGSFRTANIPLGNSYNEMFPPDPDVAGYTPAGSYAWPEFTSWVNQSESVIDPQTGLLLKRATMPLDYPTNWLGNEAFQTAIALDGKWLNASAATTDDSASAVFPGGGNNWLFLRDEKLNIGGSYYASMMYPDRTINSAQVSLKAWCTGTCATEDRKVELCLTVNGVSCATAVREQLLGTTALTSASPAVVVGDSVPMLAFWMAPGSPAPDRTQFVVRTGTVDVSGTTVQWRSGLYFNLNWSAGSRIVLGTTEYQIASVQGPQKLTLKSDAGTATGVAYSAPNTGVLLRKKTASQDSIQVQYVGFHLGISSLPEGWASSGSDEMCQSVATPDAAGNLGYRCVIREDVPVVYWINRTTGESRYLGVYASDSKAGVDGWYTNYCYHGFSVANPNTFYCTASDNSAASNNILLKCQIGGTNDRASYKVTCSNLTPASQGADLRSLMSAFVRSHYTTMPSLDPKQFWCNMAGVQNDRVLLGCTENGQDTFGWLGVVNPALANPACSTTNNCVIAAQNTWSVAPARWCTMHTAFFMGAIDRFWVAGRFLVDVGKTGDGQYQSKVTSGAMTGGGFDICPANAVDPAIAGHGACSTVTVDGEPRETSPHGAETGAPGGLQNAQPGDYLSADGEFMKLLVKNGNTWVLERGFAPIGPAVAHAAGTMLNEQCQARRVDRDSSDWSWSWDYLNDPTGANTNNTVRMEFDFDHPAGRGTVVVGGMPWQYCGNGCYGARTSGVAGAAPDTIVSAAPGFAGVAGGGSGSFSEDHASFAQVNAPAWEKQWLLDGRPFSPIPGYSGTFKSVSGNLFRLTAQSADGDNLSGPAQLSRLKMPTFAACGTQPLRDASSAATGDVLSDGSADAYKYCISRGKNECRQGSVPGDIWVNCPDVTQPICQSTSEGYNVMGGICIGTAHGYLSSIGQIGFGTNDLKGNLGRKLTMGLGRHLLYDVYWNARSFADASWALIHTMWLGGLRTEAMLAKLPPYPQPDGIDRTDFIPLQVSASTRGLNGIDNVVLQFGYAENGTPDQFFCTSRQEACVKGAQSGNSYGMAGDAIKGVSCQNGCTLNLPGLSGRVAYYRILYRDRSNRVITTSQVSATIVP